MDEEPHLNAESVPNTPTDTPESTSAIFSGSHHFTVAGGTFNNISNNITNSYASPPITPSDFRMIPMGDIDLQHEICLEHNSAVLGRYQRERACVRRVYSAKIDGRKSDVTVAVYQGDGAEEEWRRDIANYMTVRHPNIVQMCGAANSGGMHATLFHGDLIPLQHFLDRYRHSPVLTVYIHGCCSVDFMETNDYIRSAVQQELFQAQFTFWIRYSSGRLCVELIPGNITPRLYSRVRAVSPQQGIRRLDALNQEAIAIDSLTLQQYHGICYRSLSQLRFLVCSSSVTVNLNTIIACAPRIRLEDSVEIALLPEAEDWLCHWEIAETERETGEVDEDGWACFVSGDVFDKTLVLTIWNLTGESWLSQANHIFRRLGITSDFEDYVVPDEIYFRLEISATSDNPPTGYLFLCPPEHFRTEPSSFRWPEGPAYWSLDPSGVERLSTENAIELGFPSILLSTEIWGASWDATVYAGLRHFHQAKGFVPDSQDVARHLGKPLYQLSNEMDAPFAHVDEQDSCADDDLDTLFCLISPICC